MATEEEFVNDNCEDCGAEVWVDKSGELFDDDEGAVDHDCDPCPDCGSDPCECDEEDNDAWNVKTI